jgi:integrase
MATKKWFLEKADAAFGRRLAGDLEPRHALAWIDGNPTWHQSARAQALRHVKAALAWAKRVGHIGSNPLEALSSGHNKIREAIPTEEQVAALLATVSGPMRDVVYALVESGCRPGELRTLTAAKVDLGAGVWRVLNKTRGKTGLTYRSVYLTEGLIELSRRLIEQWPEGPIFRNMKGRAWTATGLPGRLGEIRKKAGIPAEVSLYGMRHRFVTTALSNSVPIATVAELVGHRDTKMISRVYSKLNREADHLREAAKQARGAASAPPSPADTGR